MTFLKAVCPDCWNPLNPNDDSPLTLFDILDPLDALENSEQSYQIDTLNIWGSNRPLFNFGLFRISWNNSCCEDYLSEFKVTLYDADEENNVHETLYAEFDIIS